MSLSEAELEALPGMNRPRLNELADRVGDSKSTSNDALISKIKYKCCPHVPVPGESPVPYSSEDYVIIVEDDSPSLVNLHTRETITELEYDINEGYVLVAMCIGGKQYIKQFGDVVLRSVLGPPGPGQTCDHTDQDRGNNNVSNLRWATAKEQRENQKERLPGSSARIRGVVCTDADGVVRTEFNSPLEEATHFVTPDRKLSSVQQCISNAAREPPAARKRTTLYHHIWELAAQDGDEVTEWRDVPPEFFGASAGHKVSKCGLIKEKHGRITPGFVHHGYRMFSGKRVHRMVAAAWSLDRLDYSLIVDHRDRNKMNNHASNLRWVTAKENADNCQQPAAVAVQKIRRSGDIEEYDSISSATESVALEREGPTFMSNIQHALGGHQDTAYGYRWHHAEPDKREAAETVRAVRTELPGKRKVIFTAIR
jgi:HNH endonuclease